MCAAISGERLGFQTHSSPSLPRTRALCPCVCVWVRVLKAGPCLNVAAPFLAFGRVECFSTAVAWQQSLSHVARQPLFHKMHTAHPTSISQSPPLSFSLYSQHHPFGSDNTLFSQEVEAYPLKCINHVFFLLFFFPNKSGIDEMATRAESFTTAQFSDCFL